MVRNECMLCAQRESLNVSKSNNDTENAINRGLRELGLRRVETEADGHCLLWSWEAVTNVPKAIIEERLSDELKKNTDYYEHYLTNRSVQQLIHDYIDSKIYSGDDMDLLLNALSNAMCMDVILYEPISNSIRVNRHPTGRVISTGEVKFFYNNDHYEPLIPITFKNQNTLQNSIEQDCNSDSDGDGSVSYNGCDEPGEASYYSSSSPDTSSTISYLHEDKCLPICDKEETHGIEMIVKFLLDASENTPHLISEKAPYRVDKTCSFIVNLSRLGSPDDIKSNDGEAMGHHGQKMRLITFDERGETVIRRRYSEIDEYEDNKLYLYEYVSRTKCKKFSRRIYFMYKDSNKLDVVKSPNTGF